MDIHERAQFNVLRRRLLTRGGTGFNEAVANMATDHDVTFEKAEPDANYGVLVTPSWDTTVFVTAKAATGFTVDFGTAAGASDYIDWLIFRKES